MTPALRAVLLRGGAVAAGVALLWPVVGVWALLAAAAVGGVLLAQPLTELAGDIGRAMNHAALHDLEGRYYAHRGHRIDVVEDDEGRRWLRAADLRKVTPGLPADDRLQALFPAAVRRIGRLGHAYVEAEAVKAEVLARAQEPATLKLVHWVEREVAGPARRKRGQA